MNSLTIKFNYNRNYHKFIHSQEIEHPLVIKGKNKFYSKI
jgi:hypothetical protein